MADNITAKIQLRRGALGDLPLLDEAELGYATDEHRLFIGNTPLSFVGNGETTRFTIQNRTLIPNHIMVYVDNSEVHPGIEYIIEGTNIVFAVPPDNGSNIVVNFNTEIQTQRNAVTMSVIPLVPTPIGSYGTALSVSLANGNTAIIDYSVKLGNTITMGTLHLFYDNDTNLNHIGDNSIPEVQFSAGMWSNRLHLLYTNTTGSTASFNYSIRLWNTI